MSVWRKSSKKKSKCELTGIKAILVGGVMLKAEQWDIGAIVEYPLEAKVTILAGYYSSLKTVLWLDIPYAKLWDTAARSSWP